MLNTTRKLRKRFIEFINQFSVEELNTIPVGYNNNIIWNFGHAIVTHQLLTYGLSGLTPPMDKKWIKMFRKGSKPERSLSEDEVNELKYLALKLLEKLDEDQVAGIFRKYESYVTGLGVRIHTVAEAVEFNNVHEGVHLGYALGMRKALKYEEKQQEEIRKEEAVVVTQ
ncbi:DinB family protein [Flammeovirga sp. OC4]|uniref:DinB family protein n=1 Tax=Flammeovirga sp. OC4 TaxID=1382345 RepID=UPI0005C58F77|nr:DinB family protein [Flammeovirga sp. OC4]